MTKFKNKKSFTLIELVIVLVIVGVLASLALPRYTVVVQKFQAEEGKQILLSLYAAEKRYQADHPNDVWPTPIGNLDIDLRQSKYFKDPVEVFGGQIPEETPIMFELENNSGKYSLAIGLRGANDGKILCEDRSGNFCKVLGYSSWADPGPEPI